MNEFYTKVAARRVVANKKYTPAHNDIRPLSHFIEVISKRAGAWKQLPSGEPADPQEFQDTMVRVASIAQAAYEASQRKQNSGLDRKTGRFIQH